MQAAFQAQAISITSHEELYICQEDKPPAIHLQHGLKEEEKQEETL